MSVPHHPVNRRTYSRSTTAAALLLAAALAATSGCNHKIASAPQSAPESRDYVDLAPGGSLRITVPYVSSGGYMVKPSAARENGNIITLSDPHFVGFQVSRYAIEGRTDGRVRLRFTSGETTADGKESPEKKPTPLPFRLPQRGRHIRLIYFVRRSQADHNMAIAAAKDMSALNRFTDQLKVHPAVCGEAGSVSCVWVPAGIAVRPE